MKKFILVYHNWFVDSKSFSVELLKAESRDIAQMQLDANTHRKNVTFNHCAGLLLELDMQEQLTQSRKLTIKERIFGRTFP